MTDEDLRPCEECGGDAIADLFMVWDDVWAQIAPEKTLLCFDCSEMRLGRPITQQDLLPCPLTFEMFPVQNPRLRAILFDQYNPEMIELLRWSWEIDDQDAIRRDDRYLKLVCATACDDGAAIVG